MMTCRRPQHSVLPGTLARAFAAIELLRRLDDANEVGTVAVRILSDRLLRRAKDGSKRRASLVLGIAKHQTERRHGRCERQVRRRTLAAVDDRAFEQPARFAIRLL